MPIRHDGFPPLIGTCSWCMLSPDRIVLNSVEWRVPTLGCSPIGSIIRLPHGSHCGLSVRG